MMSYQTNSSYGYQRPNPMGYGQQPQGGMPMMGSAGVYGGAPVVSFPAPPAAPVPPQAKPYYRCWDNTQKKWFYWEKDSSVTTWTEPAPHITLIDHETGSIVQRDQAPIASRPSPPVVDQQVVHNQRQFPATSATNNSSTTVGGSNTASVNPVNVAAINGSSQKQAASSRPQTAATSTINPNYSAGVSRYTPAGSVSQSAAAAEKARLEEADRLIAEQLQKQLSMEAEAELVASCPLPGEAAKMIASTKKKSTAKTGAPAKVENEEKIIADMAQSGFVIKKQKQKFAKPNNK